MKTFAPPLNHVVSGRTSSSLSSATQAMVTSVDGAAIAVVAGRMAPPAATAADAGSRGSCMLSHS